MDVLLCGHSMSTYLLYTPDYLYIIYIVRILRQQSIYAAVLFQFVRVIRIIVYVWLKKNIKSQKCFWPHLPLEHI